MKKKVLMIIGIVIALIITIATIIVYFIKRIPAETITFEDFQKYTIDSGYEFIDNQDKVSTDEVGKSCAAYIKEGVGIEFTECVSDSIARALFNNYVVYVEDYKTNGSTESTISFKNYGSYTLETPEAYMHMTRIKNTVMNVRVPVEDKSIVIEFMKNIKYMN